MTLATSGLETPTMATTLLATTFTQPRPRAVAGLLRRAALVSGDLFAAAGIVLCLPFVILGIGIPIALCVRLLLWIGGVL